MCVCVYSVSMRVHGWCIRLRTRTRVLRMVYQRPISIMEKT